MDIATDHYFKTWVRSRDIKKSSIQIYLKHLKPYCQFTNHTPTMLIQEAREDQINQAWISDRRINTHLLDYTDYIKKYSFNYQKNNLTIIKSFYHHYEIQTPKIVLKNKSKNNQSRIPTKNDIKNALGNCSIKYQSIILLMASSGRGMDFTRPTKDPIHPLCKQYKCVITNLLRLRQKKAYSFSFSIQSLAIIISLVNVLPLAAWSNPNSSIAIFSTNLAISGGTVPLSITFFSLVFHFAWKFSCVTVIVTHSFCIIVNIFSIALYKFCPFALVQKLFIVEHLKNYLQKCNSATIYFCKGIFFLIIPFSPTLERENKRREAENVRIRT